VFLSYVGHYPSKGNRQYSLSYVSHYSFFFFPSKTYQFLFPGQYMFTVFAYVVALQTFILAIFISMAFSVFQLVKIGVLLYLSPFGPSNQRFHLQISGQRNLNRDISYTPIFDLTPYIHTPSDPEYYLTFQRKIQQRGILKYPIFVPIRTLFSLYLYFFYLLLSFKIPSFINSLLFSILILVLIFIFN